MADSDRGGLVKSLLFPNFADAGSNETFQQKTTESDSQASTAVHDNRSSRQAVMKDNEGSLQSSLCDENESLKPPTGAPPTGAPPTGARPPPFFASTRPPTNKTTTADSSLGPLPPTFSRSLSTVAMARGEGITSSGDLPSIENGEKTSETHAQQEEHAQEQQQQQQQQQEAEEENPATSSSPLDLGESQHMTTIPLTINDEKKSEMSPTTQGYSQQQWEEEATPAQTAFGKELLFRRDLTSAGSDVLSTASEMGTVIGESRLAELQIMVEATTPSANYPDDSSPPIYSEPVWQDRKHSLHSTTHTGASELGKATTSPSNNPESPPMYSDPAWQDKLSLPLLNGSSRPKQDNGEEEKKFAEDEDQEMPEMGEKDNTSKTAAGGGPQEFLSKAMRRLGSGLGRSISAPSTPRSVASPHSPLFLQRGVLSPPRVPETSPTEQDTTPSSFLLRSPGSAAFELASSSKKRPSNVLAPRFTSRLRDFQRSNVRRIDEDEEDNNTREPSNTALKIARSCFSFDAYDTSVDDCFEVSVTDESFSKRPPNSTDRSVRWLQDSFDKNQQRPSLKTSMSWDVGGSSQASAFRPAPLHSNWGNLVDSSAFESPSRRISRVPIMSDFSATPRSADAVELKTPERIEIEREDALDILACLVERGVSFKQDENAEDASEPCSGPTSPSVDSAIKQLKELSRVDAANGSLSEEQIQAIDELVRSHEYAQEMKRASRSALSWLKSIGRSPESTKSAQETLQVKTESPVVGERANEKVTSDGMDLLTAKAKLHAAQMEVKEKTEFADRLNEELAHCRAEIGRLRSASQAAPFRSPNRSILDESDEISAADEEEEDGEDERDQSFESSSPIVGVDESGFLGSSFLGKQIAIDDDVASTYRAALEKANEQIQKLHRVLKEHDIAEETEAPIVDVPAVAPSPESRSKESPGNKDEGMVNVHMLDAENFVTDWNDISASLPPPPDHGLRSPIVVALLEQWSSNANLHDSLLDWMEQCLSGHDAESILPLTLSNLDHQVRDGFITHVLPLLLRRADIRVNVQTRVHRHTTYDIAVTIDPVESSYVSFRRHLETTSAQSDVGASSVTHSAATTLMGNGLSMRRAALSQSKSFPDESGFNGHLSYDEMAEAGIGQDHASGIMSALGGALGGLLTRRKSAVPPPGQATTVESSSSPSNYETTTMQAADTTVAALEKAFETAGGGRVFLDEGSESEQPYHRVVSAPPGRIGVTFVEYRGHAMVSDVAADSPLVGWIFPSDILIAIDELPVSGMRVRDIIKVLVDRKERQRALRVISSHAMNEFTLNSSALMVDGES